MEFQTNPYLIWQLIPGLILLGIGVYIQSRPIKKRESKVFSVLMFSGALWAFANAVQLITPNMNWQRFWNGVTYLGIMVVPTAWFLLSVKLTGLMHERVKKIEGWLWGPPAFLYLFLLTSGIHKLFFTSFEMGIVAGYIALRNNYGPLFYVHTAYSYALVISGIVMLAVSLITKFKQYGVQAYGLVIGVLAPLIGNVYFLFGSPPVGFPDPTPIIFTVTGIAFAWAIFGGHLLEVVPLAHETIVRKLATGVLIVDADKNIRDINPAALEMLGLPAHAFHTGDSLLELVKRNPGIARTVSDALNEAMRGDRELQVAIPETRRTFDIHISHIGDQLGNTTGWLIQFSDVSEQKQAEEGMVTAQKTLKAILNTLPDSFFEADPQGIITYANRAFITNLGFSKWEDVQGKNFRKFTDQKSVREIFEKFQLLYETKQPLEPFEYNYRTKDGTGYIGETTVSPIMHGNDVIGSRGLIRDVTARVNAEKEILKQKDLLDSLLQQSPLAMVINDMEKKITVVNPAFEKLFDYAQAEVIGKSLDDLLSVSRGVKETNELSTVVMQKQATRERRRRKKDGTLVDVEIFTAPFFVGGERFGYLAFYNDISERLKAEADLEKTQSSYFAVLETLQDAYFEVDTTGRLEYVNQAFCDACGYSRAEIVGKNFRNFTVARSVRETFEKFAALYKDQKPISSFDFIYRRKDGQEFISELMVSPILDNGSVTGARGIIRDITVRVEAEAVLRDAKETAEARAGELSAINRVAVIVSKSLDLQDILQSVCRELTAIFEIRNAGIGLLTPDKKNLEVVAFHAASPDEKSALGLVLPVEGNSSSMEVLQKKRTVVIQDAQSDARTTSISDISRTRGTRSIMIVPLLTRGDAIGTIGMPAKDPAHVFTRDEIELAETIASQIAAAVDNAKMHATTESALDVAERDLEIGRQIQAGFFPEKLPEIAGWEIAAHFHAARQVAGDFYDIFQFRNSNFTAFIVADVCDKGVGAALFMVLFRSLLRAFSEIKINADNVQEQLLNIIKNTNNFIAEYHGKSNMFATLFFGVLDPDTGVMSYVNGGHEPPVILDQHGAVIQRLMPTGPAVGMFPDMDFSVAEFRFNEGDFLVGFTDGVTDARNLAGQQFSEERLLKSVGSPWSSIFSMLFELNVDLQKHIGEQKQFDDITLVSFRRKLSLSAPHAICRTAHMPVIEELRHFVESAATHSGLKPDDVFAFKLCVDELCTNIIQYGYDGREPGLLSLVFEVADRKARLTIRDDGKYFPPHQAQSPDLEADWEVRALGGLGLYFVQELMDNVTYNQTDQNVNQFVLEKELNSPKSIKE